MQIKIRSNSMLQNSEVSQLAKLPLPTLKTASTKDLEGKTTQNNFLTHARTHENICTLDLNENFDLKKANDFIALVKALYPNYYVAFTDSQYLKNEFSTSKREAFDLFLNLVQTFTLLNHHHRTTNVENVLASDANDYTEAYKLWQYCQPKKVQTPYLPTIKRVQQFLQYKYSEQTFPIKKIALQLNFSIEYMGKIFAELVRINQIKYSHSLADGTRFYQYCTK
jgi:hypothetical protein